VLRRDDGSIRMPVSLRIEHNVASLQFRQPDLAYRVMEILKRHRLEPGMLKIEITESEIMEDAELSLSIWPI